MNDPKELYQQIIIEHNKNPRNYGDLETYTHSYHGTNPLCGDDINIKLKIVNDIICDIRFTGQGCAISQASSSLMTVNIKGKTINEAKDLITQFRDMILGNSNTIEQTNTINNLAIFQNISNLPNRVKCAILPWITLYNAILNK